jgi:hypothetical protein
MSVPAVRVDLRIPGDWDGPADLMQRLPAGCRIDPERSLLVLAGGEEFEVSPMRPDDQFAGIFADSCRNPATREELAIVNRYTINIGLSGPGGSLAAAAALLRAGAVLIQAGAAGVFIDNACLAHGAQHWLEMNDAADADAISFAFVALVQERYQCHTMGMHVMGLPDLVMPGSKEEIDGDSLIEILRYVCGSDKPVADGHFIADEAGPRYQVRTTRPDDFPPHSPAHNPFGRLKLFPIRDVAEGN